MEILQKYFRTWKLIPYYSITPRSPVSNIHLNVRGKSAGRCKSYTTLPYADCPTTNQVAPALHQSISVTTTTTQSQAQSTNVTSTKGTPSAPSTNSRHNDLRTTTRSHTSQMSQEVLLWSPFHASRMVTRVVTRRRREKL